MSEEIIWPKGKSIIHKKLVSKKLWKELVNTDIFQRCEREKGKEFFFTLLQALEEEKILNTYEELPTTSNVEGVMSVNTAREMENLSLSQDKTKKKSFIS